MKGPTNYNAGSLIASMQTRFAFYSCFLFLREQCTFSGIADSLLGWLGSRAGLLSVSASPLVLIFMPRVAFWLVLFVETMTFAGVVEMAGGLARSVRVGVAVGTIIVVRVTISLRVGSLVSWVRHDEIWKRVEIQFRWFQLKQRAEATLRAKELFVSMQEHRKEIKLVPKLVTLTSILCSLTSF